MDAPHPPRLGIQGQEIEMTFQHLLTSLDTARRSVPGLCIGYDGVCDAFGGTPHDYRYEGSPAARVGLLDGLRKVTEHAWHIVHQAAGRVDAENALPYASAQWIVLYRHGRALLPLTDDSSRIRGFTSHRGAAIVMGRLGGGLVVQSATLLAQRIERIHEEARAAVRVMLAAAPLYDILRAEGYVKADSSNSITAGRGEHYINLHGLCWLAGAVSEERRVRVAAAIAFADGAPVNVVLDDTASKINFTA